MGAWGCGAFENDDSGDWLDQLVEARDASMIVDTLHQVVDLGDEYLKEPYSSYAIAAAELVAAVRGHPAANLDDDAQLWVGAHRSLNVVNIVPTALAALERIRNSSDRFSRDSSINALSRYVSALAVDGGLFGVRAIVLFDEARDFEREIERGGGFASAYFGLHSSAGAFEEGGEFAFEWLAFVDLHGFAHDPSAGEFGDDG